MPDGVPITENCLQPVHGDDRSCAEKRGKRGPETSQPISRSQKAATMQFAERDEMRRAIARIARHTTAG